jgi:hypothetical protein
MQAAVIAAFEDFALAADIVSRIIFLAARALFVLAAARLRRRAALADTVDTKFAWQTVAML